jgi:hypothetical protein
VNIFTHLSSNINLRSPTYLSGQNLQHHENINAKGDDDNKAGWMEQIGILQVRRAVCVPMWCGEQK